MKTVYDSMCIGVAKAWTGSFYLISILAVCFAIRFDVISFAAFNLVLNENL
jgi:hypothetical protein